MTAVRPSPPPVVERSVVGRPVARAGAARLGTDRLGTDRPAVADYGSVEFGRASAFLRARAGTEPAAHRRWFLDVGGAVALARVVHAAPVLDVELTGGAAGRWIHAAMSGRTWGLPRNRLCVAVLTVPGEVPERPSGNRNRALRAALNAAGREGVVVRQVPAAADRSRLAGLAAAASPRLTEWAASATAQPAQRWWAAETAAGDLAGLAVDVVDDDWATLVTLIGFGDARRSSTARFVLHHAITRDLAARGVGRLAVLDDSPLLVGPGTRHLQRVLGYRPVRLRRPVRR